MAEPRGPTRRPRGSAGTSPSATSSTRGGAPGRRHRPPPAPPAARTTATAPLAAPQRRKNISLTGRAAVLGIVLLVLGISFAYPLRNWFGQRAEMADLRAQTITQENSVTDLEREIARWNDPAYVRTVARDRLHFVLPGETLYVVLDDEKSPTSVAAAAITAGGGEWWQRLWTTVEQADVEGVPTGASTDPGIDPTGTATPTATPTGLSGTETSSTGGGAGG